MADTTRRCPVSLAGRQLTSSQGRGGRWKSQLRGLRGYPAAAAAAAAFFLNLNLNWKCHGGAPEVSLGTAREEDLDAGKEDLGVGHAWD